MPVQVSYPGVYVEEIPSGVRTITGVATSITAFVGAALRGPVNDPITINSFGDFERVFGGLWVESSLGYAVKDFYRNGGGQAIIVRLFHVDAAPDSPAVTNVPVSVGTLTFEAAYPGPWGGNLRLGLDAVVSGQVAVAMGVPKTSLFNLTVRELGSTGAVVRTEQFRNVTVSDSARRVDKVLAAESKLVRWKGTFPPAALPDIAAIHTAEAKVQTTSQALATARSAPTPVEQTVKDAQKAVDTAEQELAKLATDNFTQGEQDLVDKRAALKKVQEVNPPVATDVAAAAQKAVDDAVKAQADAKKSASGLPLANLDFLPNNGETEKTGLYALEDADLFNILCIPPYLPDVGNAPASVVAEAAAYCERRRAILLVDPPAAWHDTAAAKAGASQVGTTSKNAALFFPRLVQPNSLKDDQPEEFAPCGAVAGVFARTDSTRGVWKAPAGLDATLVGVPELSVPLTDLENGELNPHGINCLRSMPGTGRVVWGARTLQGDDRLASEWKYIPVRRTALYIEESLYRGTQWVVFEPNDEPLWAQIRLNVGAFMHNLFRRGAFQGQSPKDAYFVKCDRETTPQDQINLGIVNIHVGFAPLKPAEFVIIQLQQMAGQIET